jgi:hypothetical protein
MPIPFSISATAVEVHHHRTYLRYLREFTIPQFERLRQMLRQETRSALERFADFSPTFDFDLFTWVCGEMYLDLNTLIENKWKLFHDQVETIEQRLRQLTGKSADELDAEELDFWEECNTALAKLLAGPQNLREAIGDTAEN